jgi:hypothetical protein
MILHLWYNAFNVENGSVMVEETLQEGKRNMYSSSL